MAATTTVINDDSVEEPTVTTNQGENLGNSPMWTLKKWKKWLSCNKKPDKEDGGIQMQKRKDEAKVLVNKDPPRTRRAILKVE